MPLFRKSINNVDELKNFIPTSKRQLRQFCIWYAQGDVKRASELYAYYADGLELPDTEPTPPTRLQSIKDNAAEVMNFLKSNQDDIVSAVGMVKMLLGKGAPAQIVEPLTKIN